jgi:pyochelin biosynthetic protein PchC
MDRWIRSCGHARPDSVAARVLCFAHAGGGASAFARWPQHTSDSVEVLAVQPPGREDRCGEAPPRSVREIADAVVAELDGWSDRPLALFGHSFGALVAYEVAHAARQRPRDPPVLLAVAAASAPPASPAIAGLGRLNEDRFADALVRRGAVPARVRAHPELLSVVLAPARADFQALGRYRPATAAPLSCPIHAFSGRADLDVPVASMGAWAGLTHGPFTQTVLPGGHFFVAERTPDIVDAVTAALHVAVGDSCP